ncbi:MAG: GDSL-type esterase/lipase family protein [Bacteroidales bacterium]|nr:GDSL-type esterase/lipase family protein [Bacteroidales bacterium]
MNTKRFLIHSLATLALILQAACLVGQTTLKHIVPEHKCVHQNKNKLEVYADHQRFITFYAKLDSLLLYKGKSLSIVHIGGSHVQADAMTHTLRMDLAALNYDVTGSRGLLFPYYLGKTNRPGSYRMRPIGNWEAFSSNVKYNLPDEAHGMSGMVAVTKENNSGLTLKLNTDSTNTWQMKRLAILGRGTSSNVKIYAIYNNDTIWAKNDTIRHTFTLAFPTLIDSAAIFFRIPDGEHFVLSGLLPLSNKHGITVHSMGVNGASLVSWLKCTNFEEEVKLIRPDLVIMGVGVNDANVPASNFNPDVYKERYRQLMSRFKAANPNVAFIFITNNDCYKRLPRTRPSTNPNTPKVQKAMHELAKEEGAAVWDLYEIMGGYGSSTSWVKAELMRTDHVHFTSDGYQLLGHLLYNALIQDYITHNKKTE